MVSYICIVKKILFLLALFMLLKPVLPVIDYVVNYEYITKVICVNKAKPKLQCNGKCHLMKELKAHDQSESTPLNTIKEKIETVVYLSVFNPTPLYISNLVEQISTPYPEKLTAAYQNQPFQPPRS